MNVKLIFFFCCVTFILNGQETNLQFYRPNNKNGLNIFETSKLDTVPFTGLKVRVGGDFGMQFQGINQSNKSDNLVDLGTDFNLPNANLNLDVQLLDGMRMHLKTYLSSRHHNDTWIKGGHLQIDKLDFISPGFLSGLMKHLTITIGLDEFNYGDTHFRRTDNARGIFNPFIGEYIMDAFSTEAFGELTLQSNGLLAVIGVTNGKIDQTVVRTTSSNNKPSFYGKIGFDKQIDKDFRFRLTASGYINNGTTNGYYLYGGDRAGARYYDVLHTIPDAEGVSEGTDFDGRYNPRFVQLSSFQLNPFLKIKGFNLFGVFEVANGNHKITQPKADTEGSFTQMAIEPLYYFGRGERFYIGGRYNSIVGKLLESAATDLKIERINLGGGWFISKNVLTKFEYVHQQYLGSAWMGRFAGAQFNGLSFEAIISF
ncbi:MAG: hypothetical protein ABI761_10485 [Saprospiraceae bacterium]